MSESKKERPILFSAPMVRAILEGRKTMTRRMRGLEKMNGFKLGCSGSPLLGGVESGAFFSNAKWVQSTYGNVGDRLWVREAYGIADIEVSGGQQHEQIVYLADFDPLYQPKPDKWKPSIHMPRIDSRIDLEITAVRVERLQDISEEDARAEGVESRAEFEKLWKEINGLESWDSNPWVWVVEFKKVRPV